jgi:DNA-packaging protein gp3
MAAPKGNQYYKLAHNWKKPKRYQPDELLDKANEYAKWCEENPLYEMKVFGTGVKINVPKMRAMTFQGFSLFANIALSTLKDYETQEAYSAIMSHIRSLFFSQKFEGAAAEQLNPNIIARELGLSEKTDNKTEITTSKELEQLLDAWITQK